MRSRPNGAGGGTRGLAGEVRAVATLEECRTAIIGLGDLLAGDSAQDVRRRIPRRTVACRISDLGVTFVAELDGDGMHELLEVDGRPPAQIRLTTSGDDLLALTRGELKLLYAWSTGRLRIEGNPLDLIRLRASF